MAKEWPDIDKLFELKSRKAGYDLMTSIFAEVNKALAPLAGYVDHVTTADHTAAIYEAHPDYDQAYQPFVDWVGKQGGLKRRLLDEVCQTGDANEIADAMTEFKTVTKWAAPAGAPAAPAPAPAPAAAAPAPATRTLSEAARAAAAVLAPVSGKRSVMTSEGDPNDYDAAWEDAQKAA